MGKKFLDHFPVEQGNVFALVEVLPPPKGIWNVWAWKNCTLMIGFLVQRKRRAS